MYTCTYYVDNIYTNIMYSVGAECDMCSKELNLRLDSKGNLTGDMAMLLPPIRRVSFNLYTG